MGMSVKIGGEQQAGATGGAAYRRRLHSEVILCGQGCGRYAGDCGTGFSHKSKRPLRSDYFMLLPSLHFLYSG